MVMTFEQALFKWQNQREFKWLASYWFQGPDYVYPIPIPKGSTVSRERIDDLLKDFGVLTGGRFRKDTAPDIRYRATQLKNRFASVSTVPQKPGESGKPIDAGKPVAPKSEEAILAGVVRDLTMLTQERDKLRTLLEQANDRIKLLERENAQLRRPSVQATPSPSVSIPSRGGASVVAVPPPPPPRDDTQADSLGHSHAPPPPLPERTSPSVSKDDLLSLIRKGKALKKVETNKKEASAAAAESKFGLNEAMLKRRASLSQDDDDNASEWESSNAMIESMLTISCAVCFAEPVGHCTGCNATKYCGVDCQKAHWEAGHHADCCK